MRDCSRYRCWQHASAQTFRTGHCRGIAAGQCWQQRFSTNVQGRPLQGDSSRPVLATTLQHRRPGPDLWILRNLKVRTLGERPGVVCGRVSNIEI
ncbi:hypothetical protein FKM82_022496 [Ascaphus truei]